MATEQQCYTGFFYRWGARTWPVKDFLVREPTDGGLVAVLAEEVLVDVLAVFCGLRVVLGGDQTSLLPSSLQRERSLM